MRPALPTGQLTRGMDEWYARSGIEAREHLVSRLRLAVSRLLDLPGLPGVPALAAEALAARAPADYSGYLCAQIAWLEALLKDPTYPHDLGATEALLRGLSTHPDPETLGVSVLHDLTEILTLPRAQRWEYRNHRLPGRPWRIRKLLLEYAHLSMEIDPVLEKLNRRFCAESCPEPPVGCCHILGYDLGLVPEAMLEIQATEAQWRASAGFPWEPLPHGAVERKCRYHTGTGCVLTRFKSPACLGTLCATLLKTLPRLHPTTPLAPLVDALSTLGRCDLDRERVFEAMEAVVRRGHSLIIA